MRRIQIDFTAGVLVLAFTVACGVPSSAHAAVAASLGNPKMEVFTARIPPPYSSTFDLGTVYGSWPAIADSSYLRQDAKDATGAIVVDRIFPHSPFTSHLNAGKAFANDAGTFWSQASMQDQYVTPDYVGVFSFTQWSQSFRKDEPDATLHFKISGARVYTKCMTTGSRAEFAMDAWGYRDGAEFYTFHQDAGLRLEGNPPFAPSVVYTHDGPMGYSESNPDGIHRDYQLVFTPHTEYIDLSGIPLLSEFTIVYNEMTQANVAFDEVVGAHAYFRDPLGDTTGVTTVITGLTPTDNPQVPVLAIGPGAPRASGWLSPARPNPAAGAVTFTLELPVPGELTADVFDLSGRHVASLARGPFAAGKHALLWEASASQGGRVPAGVYFVRATGPGLNVVRRIVQLADH